MMSELKSSKTFGGEFVENCLMKINTQFVFRSSTITTVVFVRKPLSSIIEHRKVRIDRENVNRPKITVHYATGLI